MTNQRIHNFLIGANLAIASTPLDDDEHEVISLIETYGKVTIAQLVAGLDDLGAHEIHEEARKKTTTRKMYQIIRNLREAGCPLVGDTKGIWIAATQGEIEDFAEYIEKKAKSDIKSMLALKRRMLRMIRSNTPSLFDQVKLEDND